MQTGDDLKPASRASKVRFTLRDGSEIVVKPPSLDRAVECLLLDPAPSTPLPDLLRSRARVAALLGEKHRALRTLDVAIKRLRRIPADTLTDHPETPAEELVRLRRQFVALCGKKHAHLTGTLDKFEIGQVVSAVYVAGCGMNAELLARWQVAQRQVAHKLTRLEMIESLQRLSVDLAAQLGNRTPSEVGREALADLAAFQVALAKEQRKVSTWEAGLHDKQLVE